MKSHAAVRSPAYNSTPQPSFRNATAQPSFRNATAQPSFRAEQADFSASVRSCEPIGLRSEESLFSFVCAVSALGVKSLSPFFMPTHYSLLTTHWFHA
jgi:hypothetical protein